MVSRSSPRPAGSNEAHSLLVKACLVELGLLGYAAWPNRTGATEIAGRYIPFGKRGSGDIFAVLSPDGRHCEVECKTGNAVQSKKQKIHMWVVRNSGGVYLVVRSREEMKAGL